ncbi:MAG: ATP-binding protein [Candidatus Thorarchaeota archaeon]|nr:MAG: ATP-binding protein [Candidatus Thorarchaeota archaeon]
MFDLIAWLSSIVPFLVLMGVSVLVMTLAHLALSIGGNRFGTEISAVLGLVVFVSAELTLGNYDPSWTLIMMLLVTPMVVYEAFRPSDADSSSPVILDYDLDDTLCFSLSRIFVAMNAVRIIGIPSRTDISGKDANEELRLLHPLWEDCHKSGTTYTVEAKGENGLVELVVFMVSIDKNWKRAIEKVHQSREVADTWLKQMDYSFEVLVRQQLVNAYSDLDTECHESMDSLSIEGLPNRLSNNYGVLLQRLIDRKIKARNQFSFNSGTQPRMKRYAGVQSGNLEYQSRTPYRVEEHQLSSIYKQMAEIEACEETGVFRTSVNILGERGHSMNQIEAIVRSVWSGVKIIASKVDSFQRNWNRLLLRNHLLGRTSVSGAKLLALLDFSEPLPGVSRRSIPPEFLLPLLDSERTESIPLGQVLYKGKRLEQIYDIPKDRFCLHTGLFGQTGSGKSNTMKHLLHEFDNLGIPFLVIDPSTSEMRLLSESVSNLRIFTVGDEDTAPFRYNPFEVPPGVPIQKHIDGLITCFTAAWPTEGILLEHISKVFRRVYSICGWNILENTRGRSILLTDLYRAMEMVVCELDYGPGLNQDFVGALKARFGAIIDDSQIAVILNAGRGISIPELLNNPTVIELRNLPSRKLSLIGSLILVGVAEYLEAQNKSVKQELKHILVLEEAHHLLKRINTGGGLYESHASQQQAINSIVRLLREARGYGLGVFILDQLPGNLADAAVKLPGITILHLLKDKRERVIVGGQANLTDEQLNYLGSLSIGEAVVHQGFTDQAVNVQVVHYQEIGDGYSDLQVSSLMDSFYIDNPHLTVQNIPLVMPEWEPDPVILWNLRYLVKSKIVSENYNCFLKENEETAQHYIRNLVSEFLDIENPSDVNQYIAITFEYLRVDESVMGESSNG